MSRFQFLGSDQQILAHRGEEVELIPGEQVEISDALQQSDYCQRLIKSGQLMAVTENQPTPAPAPAPETKQN